MGEGSGSAEEGHLMQSGVSGRAARKKGRRS